MAVMSNEVPILVLHTAQAEHFDRVIHSLCATPGWDVLLLPAHWQRSRLPEIFPGLNIGNWLPEDAIPAHAGRSGPVRLGLLTSGTTGTPKLVWHELNQLRAPATHAAKLGPRVWLQAYEPCSYAGLQVWFAAQASGGQLVPSPADPRQLPETIVRTGIEVISATPSWWRRLLHLWPRGLHYPQLVQASMGGERADQDILDAVARSFRPHGLSHLYATTEAGMIGVVSDRRAGFPLAWLSDTRRCPRIRLDETGVLEVLNSAGDWLHTGDLTRIEGDRVVFAGRTDGQLNIGGRKVSAESVEQALLQTGLFADVQVYARGNPVTGQLLAADVVAAREQEELPIPELKAMLRSTLAGHLMPQLIRWVTKMDITAHGKKRRQP